MTTNKAPNISVFDAARALRDHGFDCETLDIKAKCGETSIILGLKTFGSDHWKKSRLLIDAFASENPLDDI